jgi:hypothetical protein
MTVFAQFNAENPVFKAGMEISGLWLQRPNA